jgi:hypothetical protein
MPQIDEESNFISSTKLIMNALTYKLVFGDVDETIDLLMSLEGDNERYNLN